MRRILFVCTGNTCRSPMAEKLMKHLSEQHALDLDVRSAGVSAFGGGGMSSHAKTVLERKGIHPHPFQSAPVTDEDMQWAEVVLTMTVNHKRMLVQRFAEHADKIYTLKEYAASGEDQGSAAQSELDQLTSELQMKLALGENITGAEKRRLAELEARIPNQDVLDPFGGNFSDYESCAVDIEDALQAIIRRLRSS
ncbi:low molecular weight protein arginine phosphatase [Marinicrinis sediminis]|uniref:Low molecular weight protein arginine phosphatase n=1 Tax=Marinicrinis sediminis TaxID=1652465 RepID=A0ABW5RBI1_9BACL